MIPFKTPYVRSTTASRRAAKRAQLKFSHVSLVYDENNEKRTATKKLSPLERRAKDMKTKHGRIKVWAEDMTALYTSEGDVNVAN